jgi:hypothetical protein
MSDLDRRPVWLAASYGAHTVQVKVMSGTLVVDAVAVVAANAS